MRKEELAAAWNGAEPFPVATEYDAIVPVKAEFCAWAAQFSAYCETLLATLDTSSPPVKCIRD